jgi:nitronate monooxygenase
MPYRLTDMLGIDHPIIQAGMGMPNGLLTTPELVAAVSNAGGMGCIGGTGLDPDELRDVIRATRALTGQPFGVDLLLPASLKVQFGRREEIRREIREQHPEHWAMLLQLHEQNDLSLTPSRREFSVTEELTREQVAVVLDEGVPLLVVALGDPASLMDDAHAAGTLVAGLAGSARNACRQLDAGVDIVIAQGAEAGGHTGRVGTMVLVPEITRLAASAGVPVVAAGGISTGEAIVAAFALGAEGVWCGTVFLFSEEVNLHVLQRDQLSNATSTQLGRSRVYTGKPSRMFVNEVIRAWDASGLEPLPMPHQRIMMDDFSEAARAAGRFDLVSNPAGQVAGLLAGEAVPAVKIVERLIAEVETTFDEVESVRRAFTGRQRANSDVGLGGRSGQDSAGT